MKRKPAALRFVLLATTTLPLSGCFSAVARSGDGWTGTKTPTETKVLAGAADVATLPLQAPLLVLAGVQQSRTNAAVARREEWLKQIRANPDYIFQHKLHRADYHDGLEAVHFALWDDTIAFTDAQLRRLYKEMGWSRIYVLGNSHCSVPFLQEIWAPIQASPDHPDWQIMEQLTHNPSLPTEWLESIAQNQAKFGRSSSAAKESLRKRRLAMDTDGNGMTDGWEIEKFGHIGIDPQADPDGDGLTNLQEFQQHTEPNDFYNGILPILKGDGKPDAFDTLITYVYKPDGSPWPFAPVTFTIDAGGRLLSAQRGGPEYSKKVPVRCDENGVARAYLQPL